VDDDRIELAEPNFTPLGKEEAAEAIRLLAVLIRAAHARPRASTFSPPRASPSAEDLADGSPSAPRNGGKLASGDAAGGGR
jgi:hypothetical protein